MDREELESRLNQNRKRLDEAEARLASCKAEREEQALLIAKQPKEMNALRASLAQKYHDEASISIKEDGQVVRERTLIHAPTHSRYQSNDETIWSNDKPLAEEFNYITSETLNQMMIPQPPCLQPRPHHHGLLRANTGTTVRHRRVGDQEETLVCFQI